MYLILVSIVLATIIGVVLFIYSTDKFGFLYDFASVIGFLIMIGSGISAIIYGFLIWDWISADYKAQIINREYGTNYSQSEVFYANNVIDTIRQLDRQRIEINGNILHK